jgi:aspartyl-tRNA(Asn)/glutamyl-tRNA(Gln) amidotransferase subunit B
MNEHELLTNSDYKIDIGIEVHVQLNTKSKIFCYCQNGPAEQANINICQICTGQPGVLPVLNKEVVNSAVLVGLATNCQITHNSTFARKHYFYPDLPKNYQITQSDVPICTEGFLEIKLENGNMKKIRINRIHMEEDAGKNIHADYGNESLVDFNRTGTPLLEIVTYPDISSAYEAREYLKSLRSIVMYLGICSGNMEDGAFRADTNISVRKKDANKLGTKCELKNINSFKFISDAIEYEVERQIDLLEQGGKVIQQTRLWDTKKRETIVMRDKETAADYCYLDDPDLPQIILDAQFIENIKNNMPELPAEKQQRLIKQFGLSEYEANVLIADKDACNYFEDTRSIINSNQVINWILRELMALVKEKSISWSELLIKPAHLAELIELVQTGTINNQVAVEVFNIIAQSGKKPTEIVKEKGLEQIGSEDELAKIVLAIIAANPDVVADYRSGKDRLFGFFVGQAMKETKGKGNPKIINDLLKKYL